jgi:tetratricopeptide (TPR) repeat protein
LDELWHAGDWTCKFRNPKRARAYFEEAIRRDHGDTRSRIELAELDIKRARYRSALGHLSVAAERDPDNGRNFYLKGLALESLGDYESAYRSYYRAVHFENYLAPAYARIAALDLRKGSAERAVQHAELAIQKNALNPGLWALKATALRYVGDHQSALDAAERALALDPLDVWASNEQWKARVAQGHQEKSRAKSFGKVAFNSQVTIESALRYSNAGLYEDALDLLKEMDRDDALALYYQGFFLDRLERKEEAARIFEKAGKVSVDNVFAFRKEALDVFRAALELNPADGKPFYYMGLVFAKVADIERAIQHWEKSVQLDPHNPRCWRNLGLALARSQEHLGRSLECYEKAFALNSEDSRILLEMDQVKAKLGFSSVDRLDFLRRHRATAEKRDAVIRGMVDLLIGAGAYQEALQYLQNRHFHSWEGNYSIHNAYMEANIALAEQTDNPQEALDYYRQACEYPSNLEVAPREPNLRGFLYYPMARLHRKLGQESEARKLLEITANEASNYPTLATYYRAMALRDLGRDEESGQVLGKLETEARALITKNSENYSRRDERMQTALGHFYIAHVYLARGEKDKASASLDAARAEVPGIEREAIQIAQRAFARARQ